MYEVLVVSLCTCIGYISKNIVDNLSLNECIIINTSYHLFTYFFVYSDISVLTVQCNSGNFCANDCNNNINFVIYNICDLA